MRSSSLTSIALCVASASFSYPQRLIAQRLDDPKLGRIEFPTSGSAAAQPLFLRGVLYLHSFEYDSAAKYFREAQRVDPGYAMAYWGEAMTYTHPVWNEQNVDSARAALARLGASPAARRARAGTPREQAYMNAVEALYGEGSKPKRDTLYSDAMRRIVRAFPSDREASAFYSLSLLGLNQGVRDVATYLKAAAPMEKLFAENPRHPGAAHYLIHSYDDPAHAAKGLAAARAYSAIAPGAAHAQHMTSHIFIALGMWPDVVKANETALALEPESGHYRQWLAYGYLQQGRIAAARALIDSMRIPADMTAMGPAMRSSLLTLYAIDAPNGGAVIDSVQPTGVALWEARVQFVRAYTGYLARDRARIEQASSQIDAAANRIRAANRSPLARNLQIVETMGGMARAMLLAVSGRSDSAVAILRGVADRQDTIPFDFGPPITLKPPRELLGELLLADGKPAAARTEFERSLGKAPNRTAAVLGLARASAAMGDKAAARKAYGELSATLSHADPTLPWRAEADRGAQARSP